MFDLVSLTLQETITYDDYCFDTIVTSITTDAYAVDSIAAAWYLGPILVDNEVLNRRQWRMRKTSTHIMDEDSLKNVPTTTDAKRYIF